MKNIFRKIAVVVLVVACLFQSSSAFAWEGRGHGRGCGWGWGASVGLIGTAALLDAAYRYPPYYYGPAYPYYYGPAYYVEAAPAPVSYVMAQQPATVSAVSAPVAAPAAPASATTASQPSASAENSDNSFDVHIPNDNGSFTLVTLRQTEKGFLGPQGEFYADHPTIEELKARYVKK